mgnify:CR=1 FL=1
MRKISLIIDQIAHCKELIKKDEISYLRMALILLDNAAEVLMQRKVEEEFSWEDFRKPWQENAKKLNFPITDPLSRPLTSDKKRKKIESYFDEKAKFLSKEKGLIDPSVAQVLKILHRYRNEVFHRDIVM